MEPLGSTIADGASIERQRPFSAMVCYIYVSISKSLLKYTLLSVCLSRHIPSVQSMLKNERQKNIAAQTLGIYVETPPSRFPKKEKIKHERFGLLVYRDHMLNAQMPACIIPKC